MRFMSSKHEEVPELVIEIPLNLARLTLNNRPYLKIRLKLRMSLSLNHSLRHGLKQSHRQG
jgi:hypothetical protein